MASLPTKILTTIAMEKTTRLKFDEHQGLIAHVVSMGFKTILLREAIMDLISTEYDRSAVKHVAQCDQVMDLIQRRDEAAQAEDVTNDEWALATSAIGLSACSKLYKTAEPLIRRHEAKGTGKEFLETVNAYKQELDASRQFEKNVRALVHLREDGLEERYSEGEGWWLKRLAENLHKEGVNVTCFHNGCMFANEGEKSLPLEMAWASKDSRFYKRPTVRARSLNLPLEFAEGELEEKMMLGIVWSHVFGEKITVYEVDRVAEADAEDKDQSLLVYMSHMMAWDYTREELQEAYLQREEPEVPNIL